MRWNPFSRPSPPPQFQVNNDKLRNMAAEIDARYDAMLYNGMSEAEARRVEAGRDAEHEQLKQIAFSIALGGFNRI